MSSFAPFYAERLYRDLVSVTSRESHISVHLSDFPVANEALIDKELELSMDLAQKVSSLVLSVRKKQNIRVRQPLQRVMIPVANESFKQRLDKVTDLILAEVNVKTLEYLTPDKLAIKKSIKSNFRVLGKKVGKLMKQVAEAIESLPDDKVTYFEQHRTLAIEIEGNNIDLVEEDLEISFDDIPDWQVASDGAVLIALDISISESLQKEGLARELVNRVQQLRKETELEVTDKINISIVCGDVFAAAFNDFKTYICNEVLAQNLEIAGQGVADGYQQIEIDNEPLSIKISKAL
jgi:isoleucyl-tRNA synthetase